MVREGFTLWSHGSAEQDVPGQPWSWPLSVERPMASAGKEEHRGPKTRGRGREKNVSWCHLHLAPLALGDDPHVRLLALKTTQHINKDSKREVTSTDSSSAPTRHLIQHLRGRHQLWLQVLDITLSFSNSKNLIKALNMVTRLSQVIALPLIYYKTSGKL